MRGHGEFIAGDKRTPFGTGDILFVAAGLVHRFEDFSDDLAVWVIFVRAPDRHDAIDASPGA